MTFTGLGMEQQPARSRPKGCDTAIHGLAAAIILGSEGDAMADDEREVLFALIFSAEAACARMNEAAFVLYTQHKDDEADHLKDAQQHLEAVCRRAHAVTKRKTRL